MATAARRRGGARADTSQEPVKAVGRKHRPDYRIVLFVGLLVLVGLVVLFAISPYQIHRINTDGGSVDQGHYMLKQMTYLGIGAAAFAVTSLIPMDFWRRYASKLLLAALAVSALLAVLGAFQQAPAMCYNGACRWFDLGFASFQPAEFLKFAMLLFAAVFLGTRMQRGVVNDTSETLVPIGVVLALAAFFVVGLQKDMGTGITILGIIATMLVVAGLRFRLILLSAAAVAVVGMVSVVLSPHRIDRVLTFVNSTNVTDASNYHIEMAKLAIGSGGLFGRGLGGGVQAFGYLPEALNDSIFAVLGETFGFLGLLVIIGIFLALLRRIISMVDYIDDPVMKLCVAGAFGWLTTHVVVNIGAMTGVFPLTGVTLPFLSFGGTSLVFMMATLGIVYHISRFTSHRISERSEVDETTRSRRRIGRTRDASARRYQ